jgi:hypothetical protein
MALPKEVRDKKTTFKGELRIPMNSYMSECSFSGLLLGYDITDPHIMHFVNESLRKAVLDFIFKDSHWIVTGPNNERIIIDESILSA